jgi:hypothetical protein
MKWGDYVVRQNGKLAVAEQPPVCECCDGDGCGYTDGGPLEICVGCAGTGLAWHWRVTPTAGMLYADGEHWRIMRPDLIATIAAWEPFFQSGAADAAFPPLLPPPTVAPVIELLGLIGDVAVWAAIDHPGVGFSELCRPGHGPELVINPCRYTDTAPLRLALQHHDALVQWAAAR